MITRRDWLKLTGLKLTGLSGLSLALSGCASADLGNLVGVLTEPWNESIEALLLNPQKTIPDLSLSAVNPNDLIVNGFSRNYPVIDPQKFYLTIDGAVAKPLALPMADLYPLGKQSMVIRHVCVEGWAAVVQWAGISLADLARLVQPSQDVKYVYFQSADGYYESWDIASALHPQTLLAYEMNGKPIPIPNGAPLRLASPIKLGYKLSKWVTRITFSPTLQPPEWLSSRSDRALLIATAGYGINNPGKGFWEDQGYEWFAGL
jgi:DMSO/TMAO reductase YedYZ molybdopterin-dependent catalytic subunit